MMMPFDYFESLFQDVSMMMVMPPELMRQSASLLRCRHIFSCMLMPPLCR